MVAGGQGTGEWNKLSVVFPSMVRACISQRRVYRFPNNTARYNSFSSYGKVTDWGDRKSPVFMFQTSLLYTGKLPRRLFSRRPSRRIQKATTSHWLLISIGQKHWIDWPSHWRIGGFPTAQKQSYGQTISLPRRHWASQSHLCQFYGIPSKQPFSIRHGTIIKYGESGRIHFETCNAQAIEWKPQWNLERFLERMDDEVDTVLTLGEAKSSLRESLFNVK